MRAYGRASWNRELFGALVSLWSSGPPEETGKKMYPLGSKLRLLVYEDYYFWQLRIQCK